MTSPARLFVLIFFAACSALWAAEPAAPGDAARQARDQVFLYLQKKAGPPLPLKISAEQMQHPEAWVGTQYRPAVPRRISLNLRMG
jgi:hypothetical protein